MPKPFLKSGVVGQTKAALALPPRSQISGEAEALANEELYEDACGYVPGAIASCESVQREKRDHNNNDCRAPEMCFTGVAAQSLLPCIVCYCNSFCMVPPAPSRWDRADPAETEKGEGKKNQGVPNYWVVPGHHPGDVETSFGPYWTRKNLRLYEVTFAGLYTSKRGYGDGCGWRSWNLRKKIWTERKVLVAYIQRNGGDGFKVLPVQEL